MEARKVQFKIFIESPDPFDTDPLVPVFHDWIRLNALDELLIDVTEYGHVHHGPALLLVGSASDYFIDFAEGRAGLLCSRKRELANDLEAAVLDGVRRTLFAAKRLEGEASLATPVRFRGDELLFRLNDRRTAPNTKHTFAAVEPALRAVLSKMYGSAALSLEPARSAGVSEPRDLFGVRIKAPGAPGVSELLSRIA